jgi:hypothetical protein
MRPLTIGRVILVTTLLVGAGCLSGGPATPTGTPEELPSTETSSPDPPFTEPHSPSDGARGTPSISAVEQPDPDKSVHLENRWNESVEVHVTVYRNATGETVYDETHVLEPGADRDVYNTQAVEPDGIETFSLTFRALNTTQQFSIRTDKCYGNVYGEVQDDGTFYAYPAIC